MSPIAPHSPEATRQFLLAMAARANSQWLAQDIAQQPDLAVAAQANLDVHAVMDLLRH
jgi:hypothetical protein